MQILIVDDNQEQRRQICRWLAEENYSFGHASTGSEALSKLTAEYYDLVLLDLVLPDWDGFAVLEEIKKTIPGQCVIIITAYGDTEKTVRAIKLGAFDFLDKPINYDELSSRIKRAESQFQFFREAHYRKEQEKELYQFDNIVGNSPKMLAIFDLVKKVAKTDITVLIQGESGTGKELFAKAIHHNSARSEKPFIVADCAAMTENIFESELFGHERGAFTGAYRLKRGKLEQADGGTLFIDEVGTLSAHLQMKLLRFLQEKTFERVGGDAPIKADVRIIAATNKDLKKEIEREAFREDLFYRLHVFPIEIPPLRERTEDIPLLVAASIKKCNDKLKKRVQQISPEALALLMRYSFPGNVRELENLIERAVILEDEDVLTIKNIPRDLESEKLAPELSELPFQSAKARFEQEYIAEKLRQTNGNISQAAELTGMDRSNFKEKMKKYHLMSENAPIINNNKNIYIDKTGKIALDYFQKSGLKIKKSINNQIFILESEIESFKKYGEIPLKFFHNEINAQSIQYFVKNCSKIMDLKNRISLITVPDYLPKAVERQILVYKEEQSFTITPITIYHIRNSSRNDDAKISLVELIKLWKGERDLFDTSAPIQNPTYFFGREKIIDEITLCINELQSIGVFGTRKIGKTSLLNQLIYQMRNHIIAYIDMQRIYKNIANLYLDILKSYLKDIEIKYPDINLSNWDKITSKRNIIKFNFIDLVNDLFYELEKKQKGIKFLLFIDEIDLLFCKQKNFPNDYLNFLSTIRALAQNFNYFVIVVFGLEANINEPIIDKIDDLKNPTYNFFKEFYLKNLEKMEMEEMIIQTGLLMGVNFDSDSIEMIYSETSGHPYLSRLLCSAILKAENKIALINTQNVEQGVNLFLNSPHFQQGIRQLKYYWQELLSDEDRAILNNIYNSKLDRFRLQSSQEKLNRLLRLGIIEEFENLFVIKPKIFLSYLEKKGYLEKE